MLAVAIALAVLDAARSIAAERWVLTPLGQSGAMWWPDGLAGFTAWSQAVLPAWLRDHLVQPALELPGWAVLAALAIVLGLAGYAPEEREELLPAADPD